MFEFFVFSLLFEALWLLASGGFFRYNQDGGHRGARQVWQVKNTEYPIWHKSWKAAGFFHAAKPEAVACRRHRPPLLRSEKPTDAEAASNQR